ncbi:hypothetical protein RJT34_30491 [Clitoria ternatea]|uniref:Uncharacterized protein n=1 Tax=Clitoria ternatea TaxID=43366 RepID=A0AAN9EUL6_CLITE
MASQKPMNGSDSETDEARTKNTNAHKEIPLLMKESKIVNRESKKWKSSIADWRRLVQCPIADYFPRVNNDSKKCQMGSEVYTKQFHRPLNGSDSEADGAWAKIVDSNKGIPPLSKEPKNVHNESNKRRLTVANRKRLVERYITDYFPAQITSPRNAKWSVQFLPNNFVGRKCQIGPWLMGPDKECQCRQRNSPTHKGTQDSQQRIKEMEVLCRGLEEARISFDYEADGAWTKNADAHKVIPTLTKESKIVNTELKKSKSIVTYWRRLVQRPIADYFPRANNDSKKCQMESGVFTNQCHT